MYSTLRENPPHAVQYPRTHAWFALAQRFNDEVRATWTTETSHIQIPEPEPVAAVEAQ